MSLDKTISKSFGKVSKVCLSSLTFISKVGEADGVFIAHGANCGNDGINKFQAVKDGGINYFHKNCSSKSTLFLRKNPTNSVLKSNF